jgi:hypothetical protein
MRKLQVKTATGWEWVFCAMDGQVKTTPKKSQALPSRAFWADDDLAYFQGKFANHEFRLEAAL